MIKNGCLGEVQRRGRPLKESKLMEDDDCGGGKAERVKQNVERERIEIERERGGRLISMYVKLNNS